MRSDHCHFRSPTLKTIILNPNSNHGRRGVRYPSPFIYPVRSVSRVEWNGYSHSSPVSRSNTYHHVLCTVAPHSTEEYRYRYRTLYERAVKNTISLSSASPSSSIFPTCLNGIRQQGIPLKSLSPPPSRTHCHTFIIHHHLGCDLDNALLDRLASGSFA
jgi:hypothetical protein